MPHLKYLFKALDLANEAALRDEVPVGAIIVSGDQIIGQGSNTREKTNDSTNHAEIIAIKTASEKLKSWRLNDCDLYVTLEPCPMCLAACQQARIRRVYYGAKDEKGGALCLGFHVHAHPKLNHRFEAIYQPVDECSKVLTDFFSNKRSVQKAAKENK